MLFSFRSSAYPSLLHVDMIKTKTTVYWFPSSYLGLRNFLTTNLLSFSW